MRNLFLSLIMCFVCLSNSFAAARPADDGWLLLGPTETAASPNDFYYYKLLQINSLSHRYASVIEVNVQADANFYNMQGSYVIRVDKYNTSTRFDGLEIQCTSGNPAAAIFYIFNDAVWIRSTNKWGNIYYRTSADFSGSSPLNTTPFGQTTTAPSGYVTSTGSGSIKCDFDNSKYYLLPYTDVNGSINIARDALIGTALTDKLNYDGKTTPNYGFQWTMDSWSTAGASYWLAAYGGIKMFTQGVPRMAITNGGNVGIGTTTPQAKLAVNGDIFAQKVKVTQTGWPDYVFGEEYVLPSLAVVEKYINEHKHLPGIPAAAVIEKEGLDVGEMNKQLLQKVEELTLYLIELKKENEQQSQHIQQMEQRMAALNKF